MTTTQILIILGCYLAGSIPSAYVVVKAVRGIDIRTVGSGNVGATNAARVLGKWGFISVFLMDMLKGLIPVILVKQYFPQTTFLLICAMTVVLGHTYTIFLKFKGGKGVATAVGIFIALAPVDILIAAVVFGLLVYIFKMVSLGSVVAAVWLSASVALRSDWMTLKIFTAVIAALVIFKHRSNIGRIIRGEENKIGKRAD